MHVLEYPTENILRSALPHDQLRLEHFLAARGSRAQAFQQHLHGARPEVVFRYPQGREGGGDQAGEADVVTTHHRHLIGDSQSKLGAGVAQLPANVAEEIFSKAVRGEASATEATRFQQHMLMEMARMSSEDGLVMQLHAGSMRNHNRALFERSGRDMGSDIPVAVDWTRGLQQLLNRFGGDPRFRLIVFTLDESTYSRELAPLAGHYPALRLGAPWWFFDSVLGMERYLDSIVETAGVYNLAGFNDDTRAFPSIPSRHDVWRRVSCNWLAEKTERGLIDPDDAPVMARWLAYDAARAAYGLV